MAQVPQNVPCCREKPWQLNSDICATSSQFLGNLHEVVELLSEVEEVVHSRDTTCDVLQELEVTASFGIPHVGIHQSSPVIIFSNKYLQGNQMKTYL